MMTLTDVNLVEEFCLLASEASGLVFDVETVGLNPRSTDAKLLCIAFKPVNMCSFVVPIEHPEFSWGEDLDKVYTYVKNLLESTVPKVGHNIKYDIHWVEIYFKCKVNNVMFDTMLLAKLRDENVASKYSIVGAGLKKQCQHYLGVDNWEEELDKFKKEFCRKKKGEKKVLIKNFTYDSFPFDMLMKYAALDVEYTMRLLNCHYKYLKEFNPEQLNIHTNIDIPLLLLLKKAEHYGLGIDMQQLNKLEMFLTNEIRTGEDTLSANYPETATINWKSPKQVQELLYNVWGLPKQYNKDKKTGEMKLTCDKHAMKVLADIHPAVATIRSINYNQKQLSMYSDSLRKAAAIDGKAHSSYNVLGTVSGRLSATEPNIQQASQFIKSVFVPTKSDNVFVYLDISQLELRLSAIYANDTDMINVFKNGGDIHRETAAIIYNVPVEDVTDDMRKVGKTMGFAILYGMSEISLAKTLGKTEDEAHEVFNNFLRGKPRIKDFIDAQKNFARVNGYVVSKFGRIRRLPNIYSTDARERSRAERQAVNTPIQSTGSDINVVSLIELDKVLPPTAQIVGTIHDSVIVECRNEDKELVADIMKRVYENTDRFDWWNKEVPLSCDVKIGRNLGDLFSADKFEITTEENDVEEE